MKRICRRVLTGLIIACMITGTAACGDTQETEIISFHVPDIEERTVTTGKEATSSEKEETPEEEMTRVSFEDPEKETSSEEITTEEETETDSTFSEGASEETPSEDTQPTETEPVKPPTETTPSETVPTETSPTETTPEPVPETPSETAPPPPETTAAPPSGLNPLYPSRDPYQLHAEHICYLTFDDGPSVNTPYVLDVLDQYGVKACFFVTFQPQFENLYREIVNRGHTIGIHTASHRYEQIYASFENWQADFMQVYNYVIQVTGVAPTVYRFPGGSNASYATGEVKARIREFLHQIGVEYYDWNVSAEDAVRTDSLDFVKEQVFKDLPKRTVPVILMHDGEGQQITVHALPGILSTALSWGFHFQPLDPYVPVIWFGVHWDY